MKRIIIIMICCLGTAIMSPGQEQQAQKLLNEAIYQEEVNGKLDEAIKTYQLVLKQFPDSRKVSAEALFHLGMCYEKQGTQEAVKTYNRLVSNYPDQKNLVARAKDRLNRLTAIAEKEQKAPEKPTFTKIKIPANPGNGVLSPDGRKLAFIYDGCVWTIPVSGGIDPLIAGEPKKLTDNIGARDMSNSSAWSGNGRWIAVNAKWNEEEPSGTSIYVVPSEGGKARNVQVPSHVCGWGQEFRLSLSPDGKILAYTTGYKPGDWQNKFSKIFTIPVSGGEAKELTEQGTQEPAFSPDGNKIAFVKCYKSNNVRYYYSNVWVIPSSGGTPVQVSNFRSGNASGPVWSPDGNMIAFQFQPEGEYRKEIWIVPLTEQGNPSASPKIIELPLPSAHAIAGWTPDNKIGVHLMNPEYEIIYTVPASGGIATQVTPQGWNSYPKWSPDGKKIFFRGDRGNIACVPSGGGSIDSITIKSDNQIFGALPGSGNDISPDGKTIVFSGGKIFYENGVRKWDVNIYTIPAEGGKPKQLTKVDVELQDRFPCWSPDGNSIAFIRPEIINGRHIMHIFTVSIDGNNIKQITAEADSVYWAPIDYTPDGKYITFFTFRNTIRSIPAEGGQSVLVTKVDSVNNQFELAWSPDGKELAYTDQGKIWIYSPESGSTGEVKTGVKASATKIGWSPDGEKIAFTAWAGGDNELWMMENFLPLEKLVQKTGNNDFIIRKVLPDSEIEPLGTPSPDGRFLSFTDWNSGGNVCILDLETQERKFLTEFKDPNEQTYYSSWSPDGKQIAYFWWNYGKSQYNLSVVDIKGSESRDLLKSDKTDWIELGNWSSDGKYIFATLSLREENKSQVVRISAIDGSMKVLKTCDLSYTGGKPYVSPDNRYLAYDLPDKDASGNSDIFLLSLENGQENSLVKHPAHDYTFGWTPDGKYVLFATDRRGTVDAMLIAVDNGKPSGNPIPAKQNIGPVVPLGLTRDGSFYYGQWPDVRNIFTAKIDINEGKVISQPELLVRRFEGRNFSPDYSHDGKFLAYISERGVLKKGKSGRVLCIQNLETGVEDAIIPDAEIWGGISDPDWSPDDRLIALACDNREGYSKIYSYNIQTRDFKPLVTDVKNQSPDTEYAHPLWSNDGKTIFYLQFSRYSKTSRIMARNIENGAEKELYSYSSDDNIDRAFNISLSPDGKWLSAINRGENRVVRLISTEDGTIRDIYKFKSSGGFPYSQVWSKDGKYLIFPYPKQLSSEAREWNLMRLPVEGGDSLLIEMGVKGIVSPTLHPDGQTITFWSAGYKYPENNIWVMENFLPKKE